MHQVSVEPSAPDGAILEARIPVGRPVSRRAQLSTIGWALERESSGSRYYTRRFIASDAAPTDIVTAVDEANQVLYGSRANDVRWSLSVLPLYIEDEARDGGTSSRRAERPEPAAGTTRRASWLAWLDLPCLLVSIVIGGILAVLLIGAFYVLVAVGVERFLEWPIGFLVARFLFGLLGLAMVGLGSKALYRVFTGQPIAGEYSNSQVVLASLFSVLLGLAFIVLAVAPWDSEGF